MHDRDQEITYTVTVPQDKAGTRLDKLLAEALPDLSRSRLKQLIAGGCVSGRSGEAEEASAMTDPSRKVRAGDVFSVLVPPPVPAEPEAQAIPLDVVFEDEHLIVIDKPSGLVVHPAAGHADGTLVNALLAHCGDSLSGIGGVGRPGIVHRLDKDTSGLMVVAKSDAAHRGLAAQFHDHDLERAYYAIVWGVPSPRRGEITGNIGRSPANRKKMAVLRRGGKTALTRYQVLRTAGRDASLVRCDLATGRTHQIRVHMAHIGHPVMGDPLYGGGRSRRRHLSEAVQAAIGRLESQALHAFLIEFIHPISGEIVRFEQDIPKYIKELMGVFDRY